MFYINPKHWKYIEPIMVVAFIALGFYFLYGTTYEIRELLASLSFGGAVIFLALVVMRIKGVKV